MHALLLSAWLAGGGAQPVVTGCVRDASGRALPGALVSASGTTSATTDGAGCFALALAPGRHAVRPSLRGHLEARLSVDSAEDSAPLAFVLAPGVTIAETVLVQAVRAEARAPVTTSDFARETIVDRSYGQEMAFLLEGSPA